MDPNNPTGAAAAALRFMEHRDWKLPMSAKFPRRLSLPVFKNRPLSQSSSAVVLTKLTPLNENEENEPPAPAAPAPVSPVPALRSLPPHRRRAPPPPLPIITNLPTLETEESHTPSHISTPSPNKIYRSISNIETSTPPYDQTEEHSSFQRSASTPPPEKISRSTFYINTLDIPTTQPEDRSSSSSPSTPPPSISNSEASSSSSLLAKSAPSTPQGERLLQPSPRPVPKSPSHVFGRNDRQALKQLSASVPVMTQAQAAARPHPSSEPAISPDPGSGSSKARQKKFHRHFKTVAAEEHVLNYYSCALVGDILLQGHLYITKNYFAFYSNVFGYVTKLLIPTVSVLKISKEKTARIIPNAIGVATALEKHVFGSLLSRDSTYRLMVQVWKEAMAQGPKIPLTITKVIKDEVDSVSGDIILPDDEDSSLSGSEHSCPPTPIDCPTDISHSEVGESSVCPKLRTGSTRHLLRSHKSSSLPRPTLLLLVSTGLLVLLFLSAAFLLYRIGRIHDQFVENPLLTGSDEVYQEILKWQAQLHSRSANEVQEFLNSNIDQLAKVRQSLEALSLLIVSDEESAASQQKQRQHQNPAGGSHDRHS